MRHGAETLHRLAAVAVGRMLARGLGPAVGASLFTEGELAELADALAATLATAELLGRALVRDWWRRVEERHGERIRRPEGVGFTASPTQTESAGGLDSRAAGSPRTTHPVTSGGGHPAEPAEGFRAESPDQGTDLSPLHEDLTAPVEPLPPEAALTYFASLVPRLGVDPGRFGPDQRRRAFTLAVATDRELLDRVHAAVLEGLAGGTGVPTGENSVEKILDAAGVTPANPQYAEMVFRTNAMDAYNQGADDERRAPDVVATLPVWQYLHSGNTTNPRPRHRALDGKYFPASVPFNAVRGSGIADLANCGCTQLVIDRWAWARLRAAGARIADGYQEA
jgi:hypothetical protein